ncbi:VWA domain-containing protein [Variovorax sp. J22R133]|uniref:VWA domain-containing protein n=1 Tax=Variovorax brevis TaxID=3053503 RepID=UPI0025753DCA|nr:VWA domain-containing protein [Variovorax sp. J22R133]MDM0111455.1 VWA domain-containing protein [Variovorax sp. J22R133]
MSFLWPQYLWLLLALPVMPAVYVWLLRRRGRAGVRYSSLGVVRAAAAGRHWRRHLPPALLLLACAGLLIAAARPVARVPLPWARSSIILAMDVSLSMRVTDVKPTRIAAAQEAAKLFLKELPKGIEVGLVTFAGSSHVAQRTTLDRESLAASIDAFQMQMGTAVGDAIVLSLAELFPDQGIDVGDMTFGSSKPQARSLDDKAKPPPRQITPVAPGSYDSAAIILLSDGRRTTGIDTLAAAKMAADRGVRIYVVGLGTVDGDAFFPEGMAIYMRLDEPTLREVARMTGGEYHHAGTAESLRSVYENLGSRVQVLTRETELSGLLALASALVAMVAATLSLIWFGRSV